MLLQVKYEIHRVHRCGRHQVKFRKFRQNRTILWVSVLVLQTTTIVALQLAALVLAPFYWSASASSCFKIVSARANKSAGKPAGLAT